MNFVLMADELYKQAIDGSLSRWLSQADQDIALGEVYRGICGAHQAVLPLEINLNTLRILRQDDLPVDYCWSAMYDKLNDLDSERILALENMIQQKKSVARNYNRQITEKYFSLEKLVLKVVLPIEKKSRFLGKWSHTWEGPFQVIELYSGNAYRIKDIDYGNVINSINGKYLKQYR
ncbi:uncharacterized protein LOC107615274 [Arachis ipaensis]|uniref:uncharacterized protein LOC107615274 n=1 Tax=Arachis ipaensis TaxID=130454 RepID=UPI0007AFD6EC|nr:uncharacterized protein LOC107615274 [Arachis ipaensis]XP_025678279.1 uncharacterized protein LOC112778135 [Arachis hypogaea]